MINKYLLQLGTQTLHFIKTIEALGFVKDNINPSGFIKFPVNKEFLSSAKGAYVCSSFRSTEKTSRNGRT